MVEEKIKMRKKHERTINKASCGEAQHEAPLHPGRTKELRDSALSIRHCRCKFRN